MQPAPTTTTYEMTSRARLTLLSRQDRRAPNAPTPVIPLFDPVTRAPMRLGSSEYLDTVFRMKRAAENAMDDALAEYRDERCHATRSIARFEIRRFRAVRDAHTAAWRAYCAERSAAGDVREAA